MRPRPIISILVAAAAMTIALAGRAEAKKQVKYVGVHPIAADAGGGFCYLEVPHVHVYTPAKAEVLYREHDGGHFFVGDPVPYGYDGPKHAYYGPHPVHVDVLVDESELDGDEIEYCYLDGPHYHYYTPPPSLKFTVKGGVYYFAGDYPEIYVEEKPRYAKINVIYKPLKYTRPVVVEAPPPEYHGPVVDVHVYTPAVVVEPAVVEPVIVEPAPAVVGGGVHVTGPAVHGHVEVGIAVPSVEVHVPGVIVEEHVVVHEHKHKKRKWKHGHGHGHGHGRGKVKVREHGRPWWQ